KGQDFQLVLSTLGRLTSPDEFRNIIIKTDPDGAVTYLRDIGRVELGAKSLDQTLTMDRKPSVGLAIFQLPGTNALDVADRIKAKMKDLAERFPNELRYGIVYDTTPFIRQSVEQVFHTLIEAVVLVTIVILIFLQDWRAMILPMIDVAVSLIGTFAVMLIMGFSLNNLTLFGLVLAIGIVVDDAIVVLENIERWLDKGEPVREATIHAMGEITGPIFAITLVLSSVFLPSAFLTGITGEFFRQFALTISVSMIISALNAMTMTPARASTIFANRKPGKHGEQGKEALPWWFFAILGGFLSLWLIKPLVAQWLHLPTAQMSETEPSVGGIVESLREYGIEILLFLPGAIGGGILGWFIIQPVNWGLGIFFGLFNRFFDAATKVYGRIVGWTIRLSAITLLFYLGLLVMTGFGFTLVPSGFIPSQDKGRLIVNVQLPDSASLERTIDVVDRVQRIALETDGIAHTIGNPGRSFVLNAIGSNLGSLFITLKPFAQRHGAALGAEALAAHLRARYAKEIPEARINVFGAPAVDGLGNAGGFRLMIEATSGADFPVLQSIADKVAAEGNQQPGLVGLFDGLRANTPQLFAEIDRVKAKSLGVALSDLFQTLQVYLGGYYTNDFNLFGRTWQVNLKADERYRISADQVRQFKVRNSEGDMVPLGSVMDIHDSVGPLTVTRYNSYPAAPINGASLPSLSTGEVLSKMEQIADKTLPRNMTYEWTELAYLQKQASKINQFRDLRQNPFSAFFLGVILVFFVLAGLYESWSLPLAVILVVPMCLSSALLGIALAHMDVNIFVQVGFVVLVGLASKNAILIVEFARDRQLEGATAEDAALEAAHVRLRPIVMTSLAFILGVVPLVLAEGAGAEMRRTLGTAVFAGMIGVTLFGIFLTPVFFTTVRRLAGSGKIPRGHGHGKSESHSPTELIERPARLEDNRTSDAAGPPDEK
ncbi:MAG TPA: efflux RND transporter permease subunit, partial [Pirellulales bacterium]|nr:efflux RND transporter permease subunit [Pirellulales bacterium]